VRNQRNGTGAKTVYTGGGPLRIEVPRDLDASFAPILIPQARAVFIGFDDKIIALYAWQHDSTGHSGISAGTVRHAGFAGVHQQRHR